MNLHALNPIALLLRQPIYIDGSIPADRNVVSLSAAHQQAWVLASSGLTLLSFDCVAVTPCSITPGCAGAQLGIF